MVHLDVANNTKDNSSYSALSYRMLGKVLVLLHAILLMSGCAVFMGFPARVTDPSADLATLQNDIGAAAITTCLATPSEACRNKIIAGRMYAIDIQFSGFEEDLFRQTREAGFVATVTTLGLNAAGAVAGGGTSQILSWPLLEASPDHARPSSARSWLNGPFSRYTPQCTRIA